MIISKTPFRISFFGGGTDFPQWYLKEGGAVLSTSIDKYCYITCRKLPQFFPNKHRIVWSHIECVSKINDIKHPAVKAALNFLNYDDKIGIEIHHQGDLPARSGMGSSSAFAVGLIHALATLKGDSLSKGEVARKAIELEQNVLKESVGSQDQIAAAYGGLNLIRFSPSGDISIESVDVKPSRLQELQSHLLLFFTGTTRNGTEIAGRTISNIPKKKETLLKIRKEVDLGLNLLTSNSSIEGFGEILGNAWIEKCELNPEITNPEINRIYRTALDNGALGGKLLGAGGSGFFLFFVPPEKQEQLIQKMENLISVPFAFDNEGTTITLNTSEAISKTNHTLLKKVA